MPLIRPNKGYLRKYSPLTPLPLTPLRVPMNDEAPWFLQTVDLMRQIRTDSMPDPKGPCTRIVYTLGPMYLYREYFKTKVYTIWVHGPLGRTILGLGVAMFRDPATQKASDSMVHFGCPSV